MPELPHRAAAETVPARNTVTPPAPVYRGLFLEPRLPEHLIEDDVDEQD